jgi:sialate O-acetylesterase
MNQLRLSTAACRYRALGRLNPVTLTWLRVLALACGLFLNGAAQTTEPTPVSRLAMAPLFTPGMVLQHGQPLPVWGWSSPGDYVTVQFAGRSWSALAAADGRWQVQLDPQDISNIGRTMTVSTGTHSVALGDVLVGDVWLCSGQSNMAMRLPKAEGGAAAVAGADDPELRLFSTSDAMPSPMPTTPRVRTFAPRKEPYLWRRANPESAADMSAVGWFFAQEIRRTRKIPLGLILASRGGTIAEAWVSREALLRDPHFAAYVAVCDEWRQKRNLPQDSPNTPPDRNTGVNAWASGCYDNFIAAIHPYGLRGVLWYQGESNGNTIHGRACGADYQRLVTTLIDSWRGHWAQERLPFLIVQLANYKAAPASAAETASCGWAEVREAQAAVAKAIPDVGLAVTIDIGDPNDIHPRNKAEVGRRLALVAQAQVYVEAVTSSGPTYRSMRIEGSSIILSFDHTEGGLVAKNGTLPGFTMAGKDRRWEWTEAQIVGSEVVLTSTKVAEPVAARYAWSIGPMATLYNGAGLPAGPFRTDTWNPTPPSRTP